MDVRRFRSSDGRQWRVWVVRPQTLLGERRTAVERRVVPVETLEDPPVLERRRGADRRVESRRTRRSPGDVLPDPWREGWVVFEEDTTVTGAAEREVRRQAPIPVDWDRCSDEQLAAHFEQAVERRRRSN